MPKPQDLKPKLLPTSSTGRRSSRGRALIATWTVCAVQHRRVPASTGGDCTDVRHRRLHEYKNGPLGLWGKLSDQAAYPENPIGPKTNGADSNDEVFTNGPDVVQKALPTCPRSPSPWMIRRQLPS